MGHKRSSLGNNASFLQVYFELEDLHRQIALLVLERRSETLINQEFINIMIIFNTKYYY